MLLGYVICGLFSIWGDMLIFFSFSFILIFVCFKFRATEIHCLEVLELEVQIK